MITEAVLTAAKKASWDALASTDKDRASAIYGLMTGEIMDVIVRAALAAAAAVKEAADDAERRRDVSLTDEELKAFGWPERRGDADGA